MQQLNDVSVLATLFLFPPAVFFLMLCTVGFLISLFIVAVLFHCCLQDFAEGWARSQLQEHIIFRWLSLKSTIEYLGEWEMLYNPNFNCTEFGTFRNMAGSNNFVLSVKTWIEKTGAIGIFSKAGRYGGTYAHRDIAYHFGMWISPKFQLLLVKEYQRLKAEEQKMLGWTAKRELSKINYHIHTDAIKSHLIPKEITPAQASIIYAEEADVLNVAMFGMTAKQWREANPDLKGNIRDYATINELICLSNITYEPILSANHPRRFPILENPPTVKKVPAKHKKSSEK